MSIHQDPELKKAVLNLSIKEKDKLLLRLISKDKMLIKQLHFQLLEDESDLEQRVEDLRKNLLNLFEICESYVFNSPTISNLSGLSKLVKQASGMVNEHEKITKDKLSEVEFRILILEKAILIYPSLFGSSYHSSAHKLQKYIAGRIKHAVAKYEKIHEDHQFDYRDHFQEILDTANTTALKDYLKILNVNTNL